MNGPRAINAAEAVICPFWDPELSELEQWTVDPGTEHGLSVSQFWCWTAFEWMRTPRSGPALTMRRALDIDCSGYDTLVLSMMAPPASTVEVDATTEHSTVEYRSRPAGTLKHEHLIR